MATAAYGAPRGAVPYGGVPLGMSAWQGTGSDPTTFTMFTPLPGSLLIYGSYGNQFLTQSVRGMGASWLKVGDGDLPAGAFSEASMWIGSVPFSNTAAASNQLTVKYIGGNQNCAFVGMFGATKKPRIAQSTTQTHSGTGSLVFTTLVSAVTGIAFLMAGTRGGTIAVPSGWTLIASGTNNGSEFMAYRTVSVGDSLAATCTGPTDNSSGIIGVIA